MANKAFKPCSKHGCPNLTRERYCDDHREQQKAEKSEANKYYDRYVRDERSTSFYNSKPWQQLRMLALSKDNYLCRHCLEEQRITKADVVDHIIPVKKDWSKRLDLDNLQLLCHKCHNIKTAKERV